MNANDFNGYEFEVEHAETAAPTLNAVQANLKPVAHLILLLALSLNRKTTKKELMGLAGIGESTWKKNCRELEKAGWLLRRNHGGGGRGVWRHSRTFLRTPCPAPLSVKL